MPGSAFPVVGPLGLPSPPPRSAAPAPDRRYYALLRLPPAPLGSLHRLGSLPHTLVAPSLCVPSAGSPAARSCLPAPGLLVSRYPCSSGLPNKETRGSPKSPGSPWEGLPRPPTPVVSPALALTHPGRLPSAPLTASAVPCLWPTRVSLQPTTIHISGLNHAACTLAPPGFGPPLPGLPAGFATVLLAGLWTGGILTHWVTIVNFID
jgi:hypothetical protein